jgi:hypothetical protein
MSLSGSCQCGAVRITTATDPITTRACWCRTCQKIAAGGPTHNAFFKTDDLTIDGEVRWHEVTADSGNTLSRGFCPACGTPLFARSSARTHLTVVRIGVFGDTADLGPASVIWTDSAPDWAMLDPALPTSERQPPPIA